MKQAILSMGMGVRNLFREKINIVISLLILNLVLTTYVYLESSNEHYHYYMNATKSLEDINKIKIDTYNGAIERELTTEEQLIRKQNRHWHLKYMFK